MTVLQHRVDRLRHAPVSPSRLSPRVQREMTAYAEVMRSVYVAVLEVSGASMAMDTSKYPGYAATINSLPDVDLRVIHLLRDSRGVAHSWTRQRRLPGTEETMATFSASYSAVRWVAYNAATEALRVTGVPILRVRYESLSSARTESSTESQTNCSTSRDPRQIPGAHQASASPTPSTCCRATRSDSSAHAYASNPTRTGRKQCPPRTEGSSPPSQHPSFSATDTYAGRTLHVIPDPGSDRDTPFRARYQAAEFADPIMPPTTSSGSDESARLSEPPRPIRRRPVPGSHHTAARSGRRRG
jgi:hypothetical protein